MRRKQKRKGVILGIVFLLTLFAVSTRPGQDAKAGTQMDDGVYSISGKLWHASQDQPSMGNAALSQPMKIVKTGDKMVLRITLQPISSGAWKGYLYGFTYYPDAVDEKMVPEGKKAESAEVLQYYENYDAFNQPGTGKDETVRGKKYPHTIQIPITQDRTQIWTRIYVPVMESLSKGSGEQFAKLILDWSTLTKTEETAVQKTAAPTQKPRATKKPKTVKKQKKNIKKSKQSAKKNVQNVEDGTHRISDEMKKADRKTKSTSDEVKMNCQIAVSYRHPVTGKIEDAGGEQASATGQGMAESAIDKKAKWEKTENGNGQLTLKLHLMDYTSDHTFWIQNRGEETWEKVTAKTVGQGQDENGTFSYVTLPVSCEDPIVKISMYVKPMERNVIFYASLKNGQTQEVETASIETQSVADYTEGLRLSTQKQETAETTETQENQEQKDAMTMLQWMITLIIAMCVSGLILLVAAAALVYYFRRNWRRWGEEMEDDDE